MLRLGFTGTRHGMNAHQRDGLHMLLLRLAHVMPIEFHHGECVGADEQAHVEAHEMGFDIVGHPADVPAKLRAKLPADQFLIRAVEKGPLLRNHDIVNATEMLIVAPRSRRVESRGGTWATFNIARAAGKPSLVLWP